MLPAVSPSHPMVLLATQGLYGPPGCQTCPRWHWSDICLWMQPTCKQIFPLKYISWSSFLRIYFSLLVCFPVSRLEPFVEWERVLKKDTNESIRWASQASQWVKNPPVKQETEVRSQIGKIPWRRKWQSTPVSFPGKSHGQRSLAGPHPWDHKRARHDLVTK